MEVDTNIFQIDLKVLKDAAEMATGDPEFCKECNAVFNKDSKTTPLIGQDGDQNWKCEFCNTGNKVCFEEEELPKSSTVNYLLEAAAQVADKKLGEAS